METAIWIAIVVAAAAVLVSVVLVSVRRGGGLRFRVRPGPVAQPTREGEANEAARDRGGEMGTPEEPEPVEEASAHDRRRATGA